LKEFSDNIVLNDDYDNDWYVVAKFFYSFKWTSSSERILFNYF
jgi:hypothetical protein